MEQEEKKEKKGRKGMPFMATVKNSFRVFKTKRVRLAFSIILSLLAVAIFTLALNMSFVNEDNIILRENRRLGHEMIILQTDITRVDAETFSIEQLDLIQDSIGTNAKVMPMGLIPFNVMWSEFNFVQNHIEHYRLYEYWQGERITRHGDNHFLDMGDNSFGLVELDATTGTDDANLTIDNRASNLSLHRLPQTPYEIAITDFHAEMFLRFGFHSTDFAVQISNVDQLVGKTLYNASDNPLGLTITGVFSTEISLDMVKEDLDFSSREKISGFEALFGLSTSVQRSLITSSFVSSGFLDYHNSNEQFEHFDGGIRGVLIKVDGSFNAARFLNNLRATFPPPQEEFFLDAWRDLYLQTYTSGVFYHNEFFINMMSFIGLILGGVFAIFAILLQMNFQKVSFDMRKKEIGILRALGAKNKDIVAGHIMESVLITTVVVILAATMVLIMQAIINAVFGISLVSFTVLSVFIFIVFCYGTSAIATILPILRVGRMKPIDVIAGK